MGDNRWAIIDSCINPQDKEPAAISYLRSLGIEPEHSVDLIVATHWHDDHIRGLARSVECCPNALFSCSLAFTKKEFFAAVTRFNKNNKIISGSGVNELYKIYQLLQSKKPKLASANTRIYSIDNSKMSHGQDVEFWALSPSNHEVDKFLVSLAQEMPKIMETKYRATSSSPNHGALVNLVKIGQFAILLGSDLETSSDNTLGWDAIIRERDSLHPKSSIYKVAHHGSPYAHHDGIWSELLHNEPFALVTPWNKNEGLPSPDDLSRISSLTPNGYITSTIRQLATKIKRGPAVERTIQEIAGGKLRRAESSFGIIRLRSEPSNFDNWVVDRSESAMSITNLVSSF